MARAKFDPNRVLGDKIKDLSRQELCELVAKLCAVVRAEVGAGGVRGGVYPDNISVDEDGAVALGAAKTEDWTGQELQFAAPELYWNGKHSPASDVYSLGLLLYYGVTRGKLPFDGEGGDAQLRRMDGDPIVVPAAAGQRLGEIIAKATQFKAGDRYQSMEELGILLDGCVKNLYLGGVPSAETIFNKNDGELNDLERMMVSIIEKSDASVLAEPETPPEEPQPEIPVEGPTAEPPVEEAPVEKPRIEETPSEKAPAEEPQPEDVKIYAHAAPETQSEKKEPAPARKPPVVHLREEKNPELAPVVPAKPVKTPAVQYTKNLEREKKLAEEVKKRKRRSVAVILVMCAALVVIAIAFNALLHDLNDVPTPDNPIVAGIQTTSPGYAQDYASPTDGTENAPTTGGTLDNDTVEGAPAVSAPPAGGGESRYEVIVADVSWTDAQALCQSRGGHLAVVTSAEELEKIIDLANEQGVEMLWLGCHRIDGVLVWETDEAVDYYPWGTGEPSLEDTGDNVSEDYLLLWYHNGWVYNDSRNDPVADYPRWYSGNIAYVCEYDG